MGSRPDLLDHANPNAASTSCSCDYDSAHGPRMSSTNIPWLANFSVHAPTREYTDLSPWSTYAPNRILALQRIKENKMSQRRFTPQKQQRNPKARGAKPPFDEPEQSFPGLEEKMRTKPDHGEESYR